MKITVLMENTTDSGLQSEHGLSLYIEYGNKKILLDAGASVGFSENAKILGVNLSTVDMAFLSHGHYDHSGGFAAFAGENRRALVYTMATAFRRFASTSGGILHEIGVPQPVCAALKGRIIKVENVLRVSEGITLIPHSLPDLDIIGKRAGLYREWQETWGVDDFAHEMSVVFQTDAGLVICNSCSHGGVSNIIKEVKAVFPKEKIYAYVGGLHMKGHRNGEEICTFTTEEIQALTDNIKAENIQLLITGHCTGEAAMKLLAKELENGQLLKMCSGRSFYIGTER